MVATSQAIRLDPHAMDIYTQERGLDGHLRAIQYGCIKRWRRCHRCCTSMIYMLRTCSDDCQGTGWNLTFAITVRMPAAVPWYQRRKARDSMYATACN